VLTLALYVILALAVGGVLFFVSVALFGGSTTETAPLPAAQFDPNADILEPPAVRERSDLALVAPDAVPVELPLGRAMSAGDVESLRLPVALRGYRMAETDEALDRLAQELRERDRELRERDDELAVLRARLTGTAAGPDPSGAAQIAAASSAREQPTEDADWVDPDWMTQAGSQEPAE
jgi:DivIVA domain-containing protein